jgi:NAD(P)-dependent dehydrogenase (short-subunit alcohol dehydrogenase family)
MYSRDKLSGYIMTTEPESASIETLLSLAGQRALVTGASGNIGSAIALRLAGAGAEVVVHYNNDKAGAGETAARITAAGGVAVAVQADLSTDEGVKYLFGKIDQSGVAVSIVANNAGSYAVHGIEEMTSTEWRQSLAHNLDSAFRVGQAAARRLLAQKMPGAVVNIASIEGSDPAVGHAHYASAKAGLLMLTKASALEYGPHGIRFNAVSPGLIERAGIEHSWPEGVARWKKQAPLKRLGTPTDVANATLFLLSPAAGWISGAEIKVDGGMSTVSRW